MWWLLPLVLELGKWRKCDQESKVILCHRLSLSIRLDCMRGYLSSCVLTPLPKRKNSNQNKHKSGMGVYLSGTY